MKRNSIFKRVLALGLAVCMTFGLTACKNSEDKNKPENGTSTVEQYSGKDFIYAASYINLDVNEYISNVAVKDDTMYILANGENEAGNYFYQKIFRIDLSSSKVEAIPTNYEVKVYGDETNPDYVETPEYAINIGVLSDGSLVTLIDAYEYETQNEFYKLAFLDKEGNVKDVVEISDDIKLEDVDYSYPRELFVDKNDNIYVSDDANAMWRYDREGNFTGKVMFDGLDWSYAMGLTGEDVPITISWGNSGLIVYKIDFEAGKISEYCSLDEGFYDLDMIISGTNGETYFKGSNGIYRIDLKTGQTEQILDWLDSDVVSDSLSSVYMDKNGEFCALLSDPLENEKYSNELMLLRETPVSELPVKTMLVLGGVSINQDTRETVVKFNRKNDKYRVQIRNYEEEHEDYEEAISALNNDILSGNAPDIIQIDNLNMDVYANKGIFADLNKYFESDPDVDQDDYFESVLDMATTKNGELIFIPNSFSVATIFGRTEDVGEKIGWTAQDMKKCIEEHPDMQIISYTDKMSALQSLMWSNYGRYMDWNEGKCHFDSDEFKTILEIANKFPKEVSYDGDYDSISGLMNHTTLLSVDYIYDFYDYELAMKKFNDEPVTPVGFPTESGNGACISPNGGFAINAGSENADASWEFIKSFITPDFYVGSYIYGFPTLKSAFDKKAEESMKKETRINEDGEEEEVVTMSYGIDDYVFEMHALTEEQVKSIRDLIDNSTTYINHGDSIYGIIEEEVAAYFDGGKSVDEVAAVIQSRCQMYVDESN